MSDELFDEVVAEMELWARRAEYWRRVACEFARGDRDVYPFSPLGAKALLIADRSAHLNWAPDPTWDPPADVWRLRHWWGSGDRPLGQLEPERITS